MAAKITRALQKVFGGALVATGNIAQFGSLQAGSIAYSTDPVVIQGLARYLQGWLGAVIGNSSPALEDRNAIDYLVTRQLAYLFQSGVPEWETNTEYFIGNFCASAGVIYRSKTDNNIGHAVADTNNWETLASTIAGAIVDPAQLSRAWIYFDGIAGVKGDSYNCELTKLGTGNYRIDFTNPLPYGNYGYNLSCQQENAIAATIMATRFPGDTKTVNQFQMRTVSCFDSSSFDAPQVSVEIFSKG